MSADVPMTRNEKRAFVLRAAFALSLALRTMNANGDKLRAVAHLYAIEDPAGEDILFEYASRAVAALRGRPPGVATIAKALSRALADFPHDAGEERAALEFAEETAQTEMALYVRLMAQAERAEQ